MKSQQLRDFNSFFRIYWCVKTKREFQPRCCGVNVIITAEWRRTEWSRLSVTGWHTYSVFILTLRCSLWWSIVQYRLTFMWTHICRCCFCVDNQSRRHVFATQPAEKLCQKQNMNYPVMLSYRGNTGWTNMRHAETDSADTRRVNKVRTEEIC